MQRFANKIAVVTGGGRGIGQEIARALAAEGAKVAVVSRSASSCGKAADEINAAFTGPSSSPIFLASSCTAAWSATSTA